MGNATEMIYPDSTRIKQTCDLNNLLTQFTTTRNQAILYRYDIHGRRIQKTVNEIGQQF